MSEERRSALDNDQMLFTILSALVKKNDGKIVLSESDLDSITKKDMVMMYYNKEEKEIILSNHFLRGPTEEN